MLAQIVQGTPAMQRKMRRPKHTYAVQHMPFQIQPFFIAPVMPGETLKNLTVQGRAISDPLATGFGNILPWWHEQFFFYVKLRDLDIRDQVEAMLLDGSALPTTVAASLPTYFQGDAVDWVGACLKRVTEEYFRNEGETTAPLIGGLPLAAAVQHGYNWADSLIVDGAMPTNNDLQNPEGERDPLAAHLEAYERMRAMRMVDMSFNEWLGMYGVKVPGEGDERNKPELIRYARNWTYPTNTVEPTTGVPSAAAVWSVNERADKDRYFTEPGFLFGVTLARPKLYMGNQRGAAVSMLSDAYAWLNALFRDRPESAVKEFAGGASPGALGGPLRGQTAGYWVDVRDLFLYGDQFVSSGAALPNPWAPALPAANGEKRWVTQAMIDALFLASGTNKIRQDGMIDLNIAGHPTTATDNT